VVEYLWVFRHVGFFISLAVAPDGRGHEGDTEW
jgi:hypothetical protein